MGKLGVVGSNLLDQLNLEHSILLTPISSPLTFLSFSQQLPGQQFARAPGRV